MEKIYGIDLGTTNSLIGFGDELLSGLVPSAADLTAMKAGAEVYNSPQAMRSFKVEMSMGNEGLASIMASSLVLRELRNIAGGDAVRDVVISVPAFFNDSQREATRTAAEKAGLNVRHIINEPTAAALWLTDGVNKTLLVYDLGGGTFDATVIDTTYMSGNVEATDGCFVGGDNLDVAIKDRLLKEAGLSRWRLTDAEHLSLLRKAETAKMQIQRERRDAEVSMTEYGGGTVTLTVKTYAELMKHVFAETIGIVRSVIHEALLDRGGTDWEFAFVGGSTRCPYLREWVTETFNGTAIPMHYNPDKVVAQGAALCAKYIMDGVFEERVSDVCRKLSIGCVTGRLAELLPPNTKTPVESDEVIFTNAADCTSISIDLYEGNAELVTDANRIGTLTYDYKRLVRKGDGFVAVKVRVYADGKVILKAREGAAEWSEIELRR
jgi:molecular chaperone DnaK (HSP70)